MFGKKAQKDSPGTFDRENLKPVIRASICTGEQVAGFKDLRTGKFSEIMLIQSEADRKSFLSRYGISADELTKEW